MEGCSKEGGGSGGGRIGAGTESAEVKLDIKASISARFSRRTAQRARRRCHLAVVLFRIRREGTPLLIFIVGASDGAIEADETP